MFAPSFLAVALALLVAYLLSPHRDICQDYSYDHFTGNTCDVFSNDYETARQRFRDACPTTTTALEVYNKNYTMDICVVAGQAPGLVVHVSGTHGIEGFAGSAIQVAYLRRQRGEANHHHPTMVFVHAFNPYGMAKYRRFNENNVDLNRNGLTDEQWKSYATNHWNHDNFERMRPFFAPSLAGDYLWLSVAKLAALALSSIVRYGIPTLKEAMVGGQYHDPTAIFYGGKKREKSFDVLDDWLQGFLSTNTSNQDVLTWVDVHTGLGKSGQDTLLTMANAGDLEDICRWFPGTECSLNDAASVNQGYEKVIGGGIDHIRAKHFPSAKNALLFAQEFGTVPLTFVGVAVVLENAAHNQGLDWTKSTTLHAFYPQYGPWRLKTLQNGLRVIQQSERRSMQLSGEK